MTFRGSERPAPVSSRVQKGWVRGAQGNAIAQIVEVVGNQGRRFEEGPVCCGGCGCAGIGCGRKWVGGILRDKGGYSGLRGDILA